MNDMYYNDYFDVGFSCNQFPLNNQISYCDDLYKKQYRSSVSSISSNTMGDNFFNANEGFAKGNMQSNIYKPYKLTNPPVPTVTSERERLLLDVQKFSFAMWDLNLYLNTHPTDRNVMMLFDQYRTAYRKAMNDYENKFGTLQLNNVNTNSGSWEWNKGPWPWEV